MAHGHGHGLAGQPGLLGALALHGDGELLVAAFQRRVDVPNARHVREPAYDLLAPQLQDHRVLAHQLDFDPRHAVAPGTGGDAQADTGANGQQRTDAILCFDRAEVALLLVLEVDAELASPPPAGPRASGATIVAVTDIGDIQLLAPCVEDLVQLVVQRVDLLQRVLPRRVDLDHDLALHRVG